MINSFCIEAPVPVSGSAQGHFETRRRTAKVTYCHWETPVPGGAFLYLASGLPFRLRPVGLALRAAGPVPPRPGDAQLSVRASYNNSLTRSGGRSWPALLMKNSKSAPEPQYSIFLSIHV